MAEQMTEMELMFQEKQNTGLAWTCNEDFESRNELFRHLEMTGHALDPLIYNFKLSLPPLPPSYDIAK